MFDAREVRAVLAARAEDVCRLLLPAGRRDGNRWRVGDWDNTAGQSLAVELDGAHAGMWRDFAPAGGDGDGGDLIKLWMHRRGVDFRKALEEIGREFQVREVAEGWKKAEVRLKESPAPRKFSEKDLLGMYKPVQEGSAVWKWLVEVRKLKVETLVKYGIGECRRKWRDEQEHDFVVFPYRDETGKLVLLKFRDIAAKKNMWTWPRLEEGGRVILFGTSVVAGMKDLIVTEGELDAMTLDGYGFSAASLPFGAQASEKDKQSDGVPDRKCKWIEEQMTWLEGFECVFLAGDMDEVGRKAWEKVIARLGEWRVRLVTWPDGHKDANECAMHGVGAGAIGKAISTAQGLDPERLVRPENVRERILDLYFPDDRKVDEGDPLPYRFPAEFKFRPGELTVWQGYTGSGKTQVLNNCLVYWAREKDRRYCVASLEVDAADTFWYQGRIWSGKRKPDGEAEFNRQMAWLQEWASAYYHVGAAPLEDVFKIFEFEARKRGAWHFVLDSLMRVEGIKSDDYDGQKGVCDKCIEFARRYGVHVHLVCHSKKPDQRHPVERCWPSKYDISGSAALANLPHNIVCVWRNKGKEDALYEAECMPMGEERMAMMTQWTAREDTLLIVQKNRKTGGEGEKRLWFEAGSCRFREER